MEGLNTSKNESLDKNREIKEKKEGVTSIEQERLDVISKLNPAFKEFFKKVDFDVYKLDSNNVASSVSDAKFFFLKDKKYEPSEDSDFHLQEIIKKINFSEPFESATFIRFKIGDLLSQLKMKDLYENVTNTETAYNGLDIYRSTLGQLANKIGFKKVSPREAVEFLVQENQNIIKKTHYTKIYMDPINLIYSYPYESIYGTKHIAYKNFDFTLDFNKDRLYPQRINDKFAFIKKSEEILVKIPYN